MTAETLHPRYRYGIGEWYGRLFTALTPAERRDFARAQGRDEVARPCPWRSRAGYEVACSKKGGVCSLRLYQLDQASQTVTALPSPAGDLCTTCPERFKEDDVVFRWIGRELLDTESPHVLNEIPFLARTQTAANAPERPSREDVGMIDHVLVHPATDELRWCALEMQAVYFSGASMSREFAALSYEASSALPFPAAQRRPDFRSSGPKRLMPQLQIKVPSLRRWGKKMAVVIDQAFFAQLGEMSSVKDVSGCDIAWFVMRYELAGAQARLEPAFKHLTTLERAVEGLTAGMPVSLEVFERRIRDRLGRSAGDPARKDRGQ